MKTWSVLIFSIFAGLALSAQNESPIPKINQQMVDYFSHYPQEKVLLITDKSTYKPGEKIWFNAFVSKGDDSQSKAESGELQIKLYDSKGRQVVNETFRTKGSATPGDLTIPTSLTKGNYFLMGSTSAQVSPDEITYTPITIDPMYSNHLTIKTFAKDSISISGQKNELYVVLQDIYGEIKKNTQIKYQIKNGTEIVEKGKLKTDDKGKAVIPFTLPSKTNGEPFMCELTDTKEEWKHEVFLPSNLDPLVINFFPEGGTLLAGVNTKIGYTAFNKWGMPVDIEGSVVNQDRKQVAIIKTFTSGLGLFSVETVAKSKLNLVISGKTGQGQTFALPDAKPSGLALSVLKAEPDFISTMYVFADKQKHSLALTVTKGGNLYWASDVDIDGIGRIKIPTENLPQGICQLSAFDKDGKFLASRLVYVDKKQLLKVTIEPEKNTLKQGDNMKIKIRMTDENDVPVKGIVSLSVSDNFRKNDKTSQLAEYIMGGSALETPFSLISHVFHYQISNNALMDVFLISNRQKGFDWQKIMQFKADNGNGESPRNSGITGVVTDKNGNKVNRAKVSLVNNKNMQLHTTTTDADGRFSFPILNAVNNDDFTAKAMDYEGKRELNIRLNRDSEELVASHIVKLAGYGNMQNNSQIIDPVYLKSNPDLFEKAPRTIVANTIAGDNQKKLLSTSTSILDVIKTIKPYKLTNNQIVFLGSENSLYFQGGALIVIDGQQMGTDISTVSSISPLEVDRINVSTNPMDIQRYTGLNSVGVIEIFMKKAETLPEPESKPATTDHYDGGFRVPNVFQSEPTAAKRDFRTTLLWVPALETDEIGTTEITVKAGKVLSDFVIEAHGISGNGLIGSGKATFKVEK